MINNKIILVGYGYHNTLYINTDYSDYNDKWSHIYLYAGTVTFRLRLAII